MSRIHSDGRGSNVYSLHEVDRQDQNAEHDPYRRLWTYIIRQACSDEYQIIRASPKHFEKLSEFDTVHKFFRSPHFSQFTDMDGEKLFRMIREKALDDERNGRPRKLVQRESYDGEWEV